MKGLFIRVFTVVFSALLLLSVTGCNRDISTAENGKIRVVTTIFPPYDFVREIAGDKVEVSMLLKPGMESHSFEPSPADIIAIENCDLFIYNGGESDAWVETILNSVKKDGLCALKMVDCVDVLHEEKVEGMEGAHLHHHEPEEEHSGEGEPTGYDEHVWTSPLNAVLISRRITENLSEVDPANKQVYEDNLKEYEKKLTELHNTFLDITEKSEKKIMIFGDRFPFRYFADCYGLEYRAAFPGCNAQTEPSAKTVAYLIDRINRNDISKIFYIEFSNMKIAKTIQEETGAEPLLFHSCHNLSESEREQGMNYIELMKNNAENLREALK